MKGRLDPDADGNKDGDESIAELRTQLEVITEENEELRESYTRAKQAQYQRTALGLGLIGLLAAAAGVLLPGARDVLFALGGIGLFGAVLTYYLTPERFVSADVGRDVYAALAGNEAALVDELGLSETRLYVPTESGGDPVRLFVPQSEAYSIPEDAALADSIVVTETDDTRGVAFTPSGGPLFEAFEAARSGPAAETPEAIATQLSDALVEQFELVDSATPELDPDESRLTVATDDTVYGTLDRFDHPVASVIAVGLADGLNTPVTLEKSAANDDKSEYLLTYRWGGTDGNS
ncbi:hypothetical protein [Natronomonas gomsonensis]|uniref:hypothetical protein n=1 Tax=Natronomonas gomsonensis TaxID=1046043 RepID=UPI0015BF86E1|nr:hypothetical protein [Natronomonas gomsonensis]